MENVERFAQLAKMNTTAYITEVLVNKDEITKLGMADIEKLAAFMRGNVASNFCCNGL